MCFEPLTLKMLYNFDQILPSLQKKIVYGNLRKIKMNHVIFQFNPTKFTQVDITFFTVLNIFAGCDAWQPGHFSHDLWWCQPTTQHHT